MARIEGISTYKPCGQQQVHSAIPLDETESYDLASSLCMTTSGSLVVLVSIIPVAPVAPVEILSALSDWSLAASLDALSVSDMAQ